MAADEEDADGDVTVISANNLSVIESLDGSDLPYICFAL